MAAQRKVIDIDEEKLKEIMAGNHRNMLPEEEPERKTQARATAPNLAADGSDKARAYMREFLAVCPPASRRSCNIHIDIETYATLNKNLIASGRKITFSSYVNLIIREHMRKHEAVFEDIYGLFRKGF